MKLSKSIFVCSVLFVLCLSVSLALTFMNNLTGIIAYCVVALIISFGFLYVSTNKCPISKNEYCFRLLFEVIVAFSAATLLTCIGFGIRALILIYICNEAPDPVFNNSIYSVQLICAPFFFIVVESALVMAIKDAKSCPKMK